jgi:hypothetical protein
VLFCWSFYAEMVFWSFFRGPFFVVLLYNWTGHRSGSGLLDLNPAVLGQNYLLDRL